MTLHKNAAKNIDKTRAVTVCHCVDFCRSKLVRLHMSVRFNEATHHSN